MYQLAGFVVVGTAMLLIGLIIGYCSAAMNHAHHHHTKGSP